MATPAHVYPNPFCNWPDNMYVNGVLRCQATNCAHIFDHNKPAETPIKHYTQASLNPGLGAISRADHRLLVQMHKLTTCLFCGPTTPPAPARSFRAILFHNTQAHPGEKTISTIEGFVFCMRTLANFIPEIPAPLRSYRNKTFKYIYQRMKVRLKTTHREKFLNVTGFKNVIVPEELLRDVLTADRPETYKPMHPTDFLRQLVYHSSKHPVTREVWTEHLNDLRALYYDGEI